MTIEEKIYLYAPLLDVERRKWKGTPLSTKENGPEFKISRLARQKHIADNLIKRAPLAECLLSPYEYIRECKKWYEKQGDLV